MKRSFAIVLILLIGFSILILPGQSLYAAAKKTMGDLAVGEYVRFGTYNKKPILWQVLKNDEIGCLLLSSDILSYKAFDAKGDKADGRDSKYNSRVAEGSNYWEKSNIREWLNSAEQSVKYSHQKPDKNHIYSFVAQDLSYDMEPGFLSNFTADDIKAMVSVRHKVVLSEFDLEVKDGGNYVWKPGLDEEGAYFQWVTDSVFLLSYEERQNLLIPNSSTIETDPWYTFDGGSSHDEYWLRNPAASNYSSAVYSNAGDFTNAYTSLGIRPALYVKANLSASGSGTKNSPYTIITTGSETNSKGAGKPSAWAEKDVNTAIKYGLVTEKVMEDLQSPINREEFAELAMKIFYALADWQISEPKINPFDDTDNSEILKAKELGIVSGVAVGEYAPAELITREQIATMFQRTMYAVRPKFHSSVLDTPGLLFADNDQISAWALEGVNFVSSRGLISGVGNNSFAPLDYATKEQAIVLVKRVYEYLKELQ